MLSLSSCASTSTDPWGEGRGGGGAKGTQWEVWVWQTVQVCLFQPRPLTSLGRGVLHVLHVDLVAGGGRGGATASLR